MKQLESILLIRTLVIFTNDTFVIYHQLKFDTRHSKCHAGLLAHDSSNTRWHVVSESKESWIKELIVKGFKLRIKMQKFKTQETHFQMRESRDYYLFLPLILIPIQLDENYNQDHFCDVQN